MEENLIIQWINDKAIANGQVEELAANDKMTIFKAQGEDVLRSNLLKESVKQCIFIHFLSSLFQKVN